MVGTLDAQLRGGALQEGTHSTSKILFVPAQAPQKGSALP